MRKTCLGCGCHYYATRSDQMYHSPSCRRSYYRKYKELILPIKKKWFDMILSGDKPEEYRETKPYWEKRFKKYFGWGYGPLSDNGDDWGWRFPPIKKSVIFRNGYGENVPQFTAECSISERIGNPVWGAEEGVKYYVLTIHQIYDVRNNIPEENLWESMIIPEA